MADFAAFLFEDGDDVLQGVQTVDGAGGVVRGVDDDGPGLFGNSCLKGVHIGFPRVLLCIDTGEVAAVVGDVEIVFDEVGAKVISSSPGLNMARRTALRRWPPRR